VPGSGQRRPRAVRVFLGPVEIAGYYRALEQGLRNIGIEATAVDRGDHPYRYGADSARPPGIVRPAIFARRQLARGGPAAAFWRLAARAAWLSVFIWAVWRFDVFVFGFGESFFRLRDLPILKVLGKRIVMVFHGSDLRPPYMDGPTMGEGSGRSIAECAAIAARRKQRVRHLERYVDAVISHPLYSHFLERPYVRALAIGLPLSDIPEVLGRPTAPAGRVRILHSPSHPQAKGTPRVREAVQTLVAEGLPIDYVEVSGQPNAVVLRELLDADLVVDQLYSDTPMAGFATEAASVGRAVIVGSCDWAEILRAIPADEVGPVLACDADGVEDAIRALVTDAAKRRELGDRARAFVTAHAASTAVAQRFMQVLDGAVPPDWVCLPSDCRHLCGAGMPSDRVRRVVRDLVTEFGQDSLQLRDKPELQASLVHWAFSRGAPDASAPASMDVRAGGDAHVTEG
jgi:glycosyltransferase involved in cell wall biosynthesis